MTRIGHCHATSAFSGRRPIVNFVIGPTGTCLPLSQEILHRGGGVGKESQIEGGEGK